MLVFASSSDEVTKNLINACLNALLHKAPTKFVSRFWTGPDISYDVCLSKSCAGISRSLFLIDGVSILSNTISILLAEKEEHSFLNINLLTNPNVLGKSKRRSRKSIPSTITTPTISGLFKTLDFTSSLINVFLGIYSFYHQYDTDLAELVLVDK